MKRIFILGLLVILIAGCESLPGSTGLRAEDQIATKVAATLTAAPEGQYQPLPTNPPIPTSKDPGVTSEAGETPLPPSNTPQPTFTPTLTPTATFTETPTPTLTPSLVPGDPATTLGSPTFDDRFNGTTNFYQYDDTLASFQIEQDQLVMVAKKADKLERWVLSWKKIENFYLEATGTFGTNCSGKDRFGMVFRDPDTADGSQGYIIGISCDGAYRLSMYESADDEYTVLKGWTNTPYANTGPGSTNRLGVRVQGSLIAGYVNGNKVFEVTNDTFTDKGRIGVMVASTNTAGFTTYLTRVAYWDLP